MATFFQAACNANGLMHLQYGFEKGLGNDLGTTLGPKCLTWWKDASSYIDMGLGCDVDLSQTDCLHRILGIKRPSFEISSHRQKEVFMNHLSSCSKSSSMKTYSI